MNLNNDIINCNLKSLNRLNKTTLNSISHFIPQNSIARFAPNYLLYVLNKTILVAHNIQNGFNSKVLYQSEKPIKELKAVNS